MLNLHRRLIGIMVLLMLATSSLSATYSFAEPSNTQENTSQSKGTEPPRILKGLPEVYEVNLDQYMCLECKYNFLSQNVEVKWIKDNIELPKIGRIKWTIEKALTKLWINTVSRGDVGIYEVVISNAGGEVRERTEVKFKPVIRSKLQPKQGQCVDSYHGRIWVFENDILFYKYQNTIFLQ